MLIEKFIMWLSESCFLFVFVQSPKGDISYLQKFFLMYVGGRMPLHLQEDFCGTALLRYILLLPFVFFFPSSFSHASFNLLILSFGHAKLSSLLIS